MRNHGNFRGYRRSCSWTFILRPYHWCNLSSSSKSQMTKRDTLVVLVCSNCLWTVPKGKEAKSCLTPSTGCKSWLSEKNAANDWPVWLFHDTSGPAVVIHTTFHVCRSCPSLPRSGFLMEYQSSPTQLGKNPSRSSTQMQCSEPV